MPLKQGDTILIYFGAAYPTILGIQLCLIWLDTIVFLWSCNFPPLAFESLSENLQEIPIIDRRKWAIIFVKDDNFSTFDVCETKAGMQTASTCSHNPEPVFTKLTGRQKVKPTHNCAKESEYLDERSVLTESPQVDQSHPLHAFSNPWSKISLLRHTYTHYSRRKINIFWYWYLQIDWVMLQHSV